jgi:SAM-dependent methyltransferase
MAKSQWLENLRRSHIVDQIMNDPRETKEPNTRLGLPKSWVFNQAIGGGQASFDEPLGQLSAKDRVLLYAFFNQKSHVNELVHAFERLLTNTRDINRATVVDIGCGPFTSGLALAEVVGNATPFRYFGVDTSQTMCAFGGQLADGAKAAGGLSSETTVSFFSSTDDIDFGTPRSTWTIVVLSYLLASKSIDAVVLVRQIVDACNRIGPGPAGLLYTNTSRKEATEAFPAFQKAMTEAGFTVKIEDKEVLDLEGKERKLHYALFVRLGGREIPLGEF